MPNTRTLFLATALAAILLAGCTGQHMSVRDTRVADSDVAMVPITTQLVAGDVRPTARVPDELLAYRPDSYRVQPGDTILVTVWDHPELTAPAGNQQQAVNNGRLVKPDGTLFYPYAGELRVEGLTVEELRNTLASRLSQYLVEPKVDVNIVGFGGRVALQGAFSDTAPQELTTVPLTLAQAIGQAGIDTAQADLSGFVLTRDGRSHQLDLDALHRNGNVAQDIYLKSGDRLFLPYNDHKEVYVIGEVLRPQSITFKTTDLSLTQALGRAGGLNPATAKGGAVYVIRGVEEMQEAPATVYHLDAKSPAAFAVADRFRLQPGDVVWVGPAGVTRWNRFLTQLLPLSGIISNTAAAQYNFDRN
jgi:polysaccharide biosynthesis/export protein